MNIDNGYLMDNINRCDRCVLPSSYPGIVFDSQNICNKCKEHDSKFSSVDFNLTEPIIKKITDIIKKDYKGEKFNIRNRK